MKTEVRKGYKYYVTNSAGEFLQSPKLKERILNGTLVFRPHKSGATYSMSQDIADSFMKKVEEAGLSEGISVHTEEFDFHAVMPDEDALMRNFRLYEGTKRLLSAVDNLNSKLLSKRISQYLGWEGAPDLLKDANAFFRGFNRWREQVDLDFRVESFMGPAYHVTLTEQWRGGAETGGYFISARGKSMLEAGCRVWLKEIIHRKREKLLRHRDEMARYS